jgi:hypothetical protein
MGLNKMSDERISVHSVPMWAVAPHQSASSKYVKGFREFSGKLSGQTRYVIFLREHRDLYSMDGLDYGSAKQYSVCVPSVQDAQLSNERHTLPDRL